MKITLDLEIEFWKNLSDLLTDIQDNVRFLNEKGADDICKVVDLINEEIKKEQT